MYGKHHSQEVKNLISQNSKGRTISEKRRAQISEQNKGSNNPNFGNHYTHSEKTKHQISESSKKMWQSEEHRKNMSEKHMRRKKWFLW